MESRDGRSSDLKGTARERLLDAALDELRTRGYDGASLQSIARRAGLTKGAIYWSFRDKHDVFRALVAVALSRGLENGGDGHDARKGDIDRRTHDRAPNVGLVSDPVKQRCSPGGAPRAAA